VSITSIVVAAAAAAGFVLLLWAIGRGMTAAAAWVPSAGGRSRQYLAGRLYGVRITTVVVYDGELLVSLATQADGPLAGIFRVTASQCSLDRVRRWRDEGTPLRGYLSHDGAVMLADPMLGGNAACEPSITIALQAGQRPAPQDQAPTEDR
jgi:hypothetical protein